MTTVLASRSLSAGIRTAALVAAMSATAMSFASCSSGDDAAPAPSSSTVTTGTAATTTDVGTSVAPTTAPPATTSPGTSPVTTAPVTSPGTDPAASSSSTPPPASTTTTVTCPSLGGRDGVQSGFTGGLTSLVGVDIRTGAHECFERVVIEFAPGDAPTPGIPPGYWVRYTDDPVTLGQTDDQFVTIRGAATLLLTVEAWMYEVDANGAPTSYAGAIDVFPDDVEWIEEIRLIDNSEGVQVWAIGLDRERDLRVSVLREPQRLVIDVGA